MKFFRNMEKKKRSTKTKQLVIDALRSCDFALCNEDIEKKLPDRVDRVTVYRILQGFYDDGKVHKIIGDDGKTYYSLCRHCSEEHHRDDHPHFRCTGCNTITCVDATLPTQQLPEGYNVSTVTTFLTGLCVKCNKTMALCLLLFLYMSSGSLAAQHTIAVRDKANNQPISFAHVYFPDRKTGAVTDMDGIFTVQATTNTVLMQISALGYQTALEHVVLSSPQTVIYLQPSVHELQEVVISAVTSRLQGENVANVEKLTLKQSPVQEISLSDKLTAIPGVDNLSTGTGIGKPVIRGLSGNRIAVFSQGVRIENQQWGDEHGLGLDENGYEQVEIIKGPASLLYGSDALGGVIYFADERYAADNSLEAAVNSGFYSNTFGLRNTGALKVSKNRLHINTFGGYTTHKDYLDGRNEFVPNSRFNSGDFKTTLGYTGGKFVSAIKYNFLRENYGLTEHEHDEESEENEHAYSNGRTPDAPYQRLTTHLAGWENTLFFDNESKLKFDVGYIFNNRKEFEHVHEEEGAHAHEHDDLPALHMHLNTLSGLLKWHSPRWNNWTLIAGSQGMYQTNVNHGEEILIPDVSTFDMGVFVMTGFYYSEKSCWQAGIRFDNRLIRTPTSDNSVPFEKNYSAFNFSTGIYQPLTGTLSLRTNLSSGFRTPNMYELLSDGVHHGTERYEIGNATLQTENSYQIDASIDYHTKHLELFVGPYVNYIKNFIYLQPSADRIDERPVFRYAQTDAFLFGGEFGTHFHPHPWDWLHIECAYSSTFGQDTQRAYLPLMPSQKIKTNISLIFSGKELLPKYSFFIRNIHSFAQNRTAEYETTTPAYNLFAAGANLEFQFGKQKLLFNLTTNNLLNKTYFDHLSRYKTQHVYSAGRNVILHVTLPIESFF